MHWRPKASSWGTMYDPQKLSFFLIVYVCTSIVLCWLSLHKVGHVFALLSLLQHHWKLTRASWWLRRGNEVFRQSMKGAGPTFSSWSPRLHFRGRGVVEDFGVEDKYSKMFASETQSPGAFQLRPESPPLKMYRWMALRSGVFIVNCIPHNSYNGRNRNLIN